MIEKISLILILLCLGFALYYLHRKNNILRRKFKNITDYLGDVNTIADSVRYGNLAVRADTQSPKETAKLTDSLNRMIETLNDREQMIREYQSELTKKNTILETLLNSLSDGIIVCDENFVILNTNLNFKKWLKDENIIKHKAGDFIKSNDDISFSELNGDDVILKNNRDLYFKATTKEIDAKNHMAKYMIVITNYTNQKEIESLKEDFVATLTHDLKVPIIAESNMLDFFLSEKFGKINDTQKEALNTMKNSNKELLELVQTVLDTYRVKEGEIDLIFEKVNLTELLKDITSEMDLIAQKNNNKIVIISKNDIYVNIDYLQFKRVLKNLINNSIVYGKPDTNIDITVKQKDGNVFIYVKDYGKGVAKEHIDKIFNKYFSASKKFRKIGTGLGLYLSKKIIDAHGGELTVKSKEGEWAEFCIKLKG